MIKRRDFLKLIGVTPIVPSILVMKAKTLPFKPNPAQELIIANITDKEQKWIIDGVLPEEFYVK